MFISPDRSGKELVGTLLDDGNFPYVDLGWDDIVVYIHKISLSLTLKHYSYTFIVNYSLRKSILKKGCGFLGGGLRGGNLTSKCKEKKQKKVPLSPNTPRIASEEAVFRPLTDFFTVCVYNIVQVDHIGRIDYSWTI